MQVSDRGLGINRFHEGVGSKCVMTFERLHGEPDSRRVLDIVKVHAKQLLDSRHAVFYGVAMHLEAFGALCGIEGAFDELSQCLQQDLSCVFHRVVVIQQRSEQ